MKFNTQTVTAGVALSIALGIGFVMENRVQPERASGQENVVSRAAIAPTAPTVSLARFAQPPRQSIERHDLWIEGVLVPGAPRVPTLSVLPVSAPARLVTNVSAPAELSRDVAEPRSGFGLPCAMDAIASALPGALIQIDLMATCHPHERVTVLHEGLRFTEVMSNIGALSVTVPALTPEGHVSIMFEDGEGLDVYAPVEDLREFDRVALQWRGPMGFHIHALEQGARYGEAGHIWAQNTGLPLVSSLARSGELLQLGDPLIDGALMAEVYTYPNPMRALGEVKLSVEAEITNRNCGRRIEGQTLQLDAGGDVVVTDMDVSVPGCDAVGDFLVLKNLVQDLTLAQK